MKECSRGVTLRTWRMSISRLHCSVILSLFLLCLLQFHASVHALKKSYIVQLGSKSKESRRLLADVDRGRLTPNQFISSFLSSKAKDDDELLYSYRRVIHGFAATLDEEEAREIANNPRAALVVESKHRKLHTTRSWNFLGLADYNDAIPHRSLWEKANFAKDVIVANIDSGVWPESKSFSDDGFGPIPKRFRGTCENENDPTFTCNKKLIGARYFVRGYAQRLRRSNISFDLSAASPRDQDGHGTHTLSTAAGNFVPRISYRGLFNGTVKGGAPRARVVAYKACWYPRGVDSLFNGCSDADTLAAFDAAVDDNVDVISVSAGGDAESYVFDPIAVGSFHAVRNGIPVIASAGNGGPDKGTVQNVAPWILTVGASTIDRVAFSANVLLGDGRVFKGASLSGKIPCPKKFYPLITGRDAGQPTADATAASQCMRNTLSPKKVKGKILVCQRGDDEEINPVDQGKHALKAGAVGMIVANDKRNGAMIRKDDHVLPASHIDYEDARSVLAYIYNSTSSSRPTGYIQRTIEYGAKPSPFVTLFSSRGPNPVTPHVLKPDVVAPGDDILASVTQVVPRSEPFALLSGTSMSCPHVAGVAALIKSVRPDWSPSAIKSAIMTTAGTLDNTGEAIEDYWTNSTATPFVLGSGHVRPDLAINPGLVYDMDHRDYLNFLCAIGYIKQEIKFFSKFRYHCPQNLSILDFNYPAITVPNLYIYQGDTVTLTRRLKNVGPPAHAVYKAKVKAPPGVKVEVVPAALSFVKIDEELSFCVKITGRPADVGIDDVFGELIWSDGIHHVRTPIVVKDKP